MQLVERHIIVDNPELQELCAKSKRLYNQCLYYIRQAFFGNIQRFTEYELTGLLAEYDDPDYRALPAQTSQQVIKQCFRNWWAWHKALKEYKKHSAKFLGKPKMPGYKKEQFAVYFTGHNQCKLKNGYIQFPKSVNLPSLKTKVTGSIKQVRIIPQATCHVIEVVYNKKEVTHENINSDNALSIDLGLNNLVTAIDNVGNRPFIINGGKLKAINAYFNRKRALFMSYIGACGTSKRLQQLTHKRNCKIEDALHKCSHFILQYCLKHGIGTVVIGKNDHWKQRINLGSRNNQNFVSIPHGRLIEKITYKLALNGIKVVEQEESYTSKVDHLAFETIEKHEVYSGKRIRRGLFKSSTGKAINADVNGAIGIMVKSKVVRECERFIRSITNTGLAYRPYRVNIL